MIDFEKLKTLDFNKSVIEDIRLWYSEKDNSYISIGIDGKFFNNAQCPYFTFGADLFPGEFNDPGEITGAEILSFDISFNENDEKYFVKLSYIFNGEQKELNFSGKKASLSLLKYRGMSYRNMYGEWLKNLEKSAYVEFDGYFQDEETHELEDGFTLKIKSYADIEEKSPQYNVVKASLRRCELFKSGELFYRWANSDNSNPRTFFDFVHHSNGHRYFPFHIDLYGISYLDLETGEAYHYIPEGHSHNADWMLGESFIVTDINYDSKTDLIAYNGCYWACPSDVMVGDFSEPMNFDPHLVSINSIIDPEGDECYDTDFARFEDGMLVVCNESGECKIPLKLLSEKIKNII